MSESKMKPRLRAEELTEIIIIIIIIKQKFAARQLGI